MSTYSFFFNVIGGLFLSWQLNCLLNTQKVIKARILDEKNRDSVSLKNMHYPLFTVWILAGVMGMSGPAFALWALITLFITKPILKKNPVSSPTYFQALKILSLIAFIYFSFVMMNQVVWRYNLWEIIKSIIA